MDSPSTAAVDFGRFLTAFLVVMGIGKWDFAGVLLFGFPGGAKAQLRGRGCGWEDWDDARIHAGI